MYISNGGYIHYTMKQIQYKDKELIQLLTRKRKPHSIAKRTTPFPFSITQNENRIITIQIISEKNGQ